MIRLLHAQVQQPHGPSGIISFLMVVINANIISIGDTVPSVP